MSHVPFKMQWRILRIWPLQGQIVHWDLKRPMFDFFLFFKAFETHNCPSYLSSNWPNLPKYDYKARKSRQKDKLTQFHRATPSPLHFVSQPVSDAAINHLFAVCSPSGEEQGVLHLLSGACGASSKDSTRPFAVPLEGCQAVDQVTFGCFGEAGGGS